MSQAYQTVNLMDAHNQAEFRRKLKAEILAEIATVLDGVKAEISTEIANEAITTQDSINKAIDKHERYDHQS